MPDHQSNVFMDFIRYSENCQQLQQLRPTYYQLGFICSVQALPELIDLEQWLGYLWQEGADMTFENQQQAADFANNVLKLVAELQSLYQQAIPLNGLNCKTWIDNEQILSVNAVQFSAGFLAAIELFNSHWLGLEDQPEGQNLLQTTILLLSKLAPAEDVDQTLLDLFQQLPETDEILQILPQLLSNLAYSAASISSSDA
ncbi:UPF0149 family protein [Psychromonas sp. SR45-3]|uniref:UPF0149 family protein n=1 Tax=Psychromonas sp. SR45-3 TaxID=2760930 RepID=UPI0015F8D9AF|nr:UPF0149 family protein [Psychromonas sp. SR45-3]MBB1272427.1 UPF0149 family protein [Psychromonas sp. SR45-3]